MVKLAKKVKKTENICRLCMYRPDCNAYKVYHLSYDIISCPMDKPQNNLIEIEEQFKKENNI